jgi:hypothetical protein
MDFLKYKTEEELSILAFEHASRLYDHREAIGIDVESVGSLADLIYSLMVDKAKHEAVTDTMIEYNDEIVSIEMVGEEETMDISVSKDSLFYANNILTKNSFGLPMSLDLFIGLITNDELMEMGRQMAVLLKTRFGNKSKAKSHLIKVDFDKMRYSDVKTDDSKNEVINKVNNKPFAHENKPTSGIPSGINWEE